MKRFRKFLFMTFGLLMICLTLALVNQKVDDMPPSNSIGDKVSTTVEPTYADLSSFNIFGGMKIIFTTTAIYEELDTPSYIENLSEVEVVDNQRIIYASFYYESINGIAGYYYNYDFSSLGFTYEILNLDNEIKSKTDLYEEEHDIIEEEIYDRYDNDEITKEERNQLRDENDEKYDAIYDALDAIPNTYTSKSYTASSAFSVTSDTLCAMAANATPVVGKSVLAGKVKFTIPDTVESISIPCSMISLSTGPDNQYGRTGDVVDSAILSKLSITLGAGEKSTSTDITGTWNSAGCDTVDFVVDNTAKKISATIPAEYPNQYINYTFKVDKNGSYSITGSDVDSANAKIKVPAKGSSTTATVKSMSQAYDSTKTDAENAGKYADYALTISRRSSDLSALKLSGNSTESYSLANFDYDADDKVYTMKSGTQVKWDNTSVNLAITLQSTATQTLTINGAGATSGSNKPYTLGAASTADTPYSIEFTISEYGHTTTYKVEFERAKGSSNVDITGITVWNESESNPLNTTGPVIEDGKYVYTITDRIKYAVTTLNLKVALSNKDTQTITIDGGSWDGTAIKTFDSTGKDSPSNGYYEYEKTFTVNPQVGASRTYVIRGIREYQKNDNTDVAGSWKGNASTKAVPLTINHDALTIQGTLPANCTSSNVTISLSTDGGKGTNTLTGITGTWSGYTLTTLPDPGNSVSAKVKSTAQDGETEVEYTLTLTRRSSDFSNVTLTGKSTETFALNNTHYNATDKTYSLTASKLAWDNTTAGLAVTLADTTNQKLTINGSNANSGTKINKTLPALDTNDTNCEIEFEVTEADGSAVTYKVSFVRAAGSGETGIDGITVWYTSESTPFSISGPDSSNVFTFDKEVPYTNTNLNFKVALKNKDTQTITKINTSTVSWKGDTSKTFSTGSPGNTVNYAFEVTFEVTPQVGSPVTYTIKGEREFKKNNSTLIEGTWKGNNDPSTVTFNINHDTKKIEGVIPADYNSSYITVALVTDTGSGTNSLTGTTGLWSGYVVETPAIGQSVTASVKSMAQAYDSSKTDTENAGLYADYTLTLTRRSEDYTNLTFVTKDKDGTTLQNISLSYDPATKTYTFPTGTTAPWDATNADVTVTLANPSTQTLKINNTNSTSGVATNCNLGASAAAVESKQITITITENGITNTYYIEFDRDGGDDSTKLVNPGVKVWFDNEADPFTVTSEGLNADNQYEYKISGFVPYTNTTLNFKVYLEDASTQVITYIDDIEWDGTTTKQLSTGSLGNTNDYPFAVKFIVYPQVGSGVTYVITGTRKAAADEKGIGGNLIGTTLQADNSYNTYSFGAGAAQSNVMVYPLTLDEEKVRFVITAHETSTLYFGAGLEPTTLYSSIPATTEYEVGTYDNAKVYTAKVVTQAGNTFYHKFELKRYDNRSTDTTLKALTLKVGSVTLVPQVSATDTTPLSPSFNSSTLTYYYTIPYKYADATTISVTATPTDSQAKGVFDANQTDYAVSSITIADLYEKSTNTPNEFYFYVKSEAGSFGDPYKVVIIRTDGKDDAYLSNVQVSSPLSSATSVPTGTNDASGTIYPAFIPIDATSATVTFDVAPGATANIDKTQNINIIGNKGTVTVSVTSEKGTTKNYTIAVYATEQGADVKVIRILDYATSYDATNNQLNPTLYDLVDENGDLVYSFNINDYQNVIEINVPYSVDRIYMYALSNKLYATFNDVGVIDLQPGTPRTLNVYSTSHYSSLNPAVAEKSEVYTFKITRAKASEENRIKELTAYYGTTPSNSTLIDSANIDFNSDLPGISISNFDLENYTIATLYIKLMEPKKSTLKVDGNPITPNASDVCVVKLTSLIFTDGKATKTLYVYPEKGDPMEYVLTISSTAKVDPVMPSITGITINGPKANKDYLNGVALDPSVTTTVNLDKNEVGVTVSVSISGTEGSYAIEYIEVGQTEATKVAGKSASVPTAVGTTVVKVYPFTTKETGTVYIYELVRTQPSTVNTLTDINIGGESGTPAPNGDTLFDVPSGTTSVPIVVTPDDPKSTVTIKLPDGTTFVPTNIDPTTGVITGSIPGLNPGENTITITVDPEDDATPTNTYTVKVIVDQPTELKSLTVKSLDESETYALTGTSPVYTVNVPYNQDYVKVIYELPDGVDSSKIEVEGAGLAASPLTVSVPNSFDHKVKVTTKAGATDPKEYTIKFVKAQPKVGNELTKVEITIPDKDGDGNPEVIQVPGFVSGTTTYNVAIPAGTTSYEFTNVEVSDGATYTLDNDKTLSDGKNTRKITVLSQAGDPNPYVFNMYVAQTECEITAIKVLNTDGTELVDLDNNSLIYNASTTEYKLRVAHAVSTIKLEIKYSITAKLNYSYGSDNVDYTGGIAKITVSLDNIGSTTPNEIAVQALSQLYGLNPILGASDVSSVYDIIITREDLDDDNTLSRLELYVSNIDKIENFQSNGFNYVVDDLGSVATIRLVAETTSAKAKISSISTVQSALVGQRTFDGSIALDGMLASSLTATIVVTVAAENGKTQDYQIMVSRGAIDPDKDNTVADITLVDNETNSYISFNEQTTTYPVTIPVGATYYTITASKLNGSYATMYITSENGNVLSTNGNYTENISSSNWGKTITYYVYAMAQDNATGKGTQFEIKVTIEKPSDNSELLSLKVDGQELISAANPTGPYAVGVPFETYSVHIYAESSHEKASIKVGTSKVGNIYSGNADLKVGVNFITVEVYAEDLVTFTPYIIEITRAAEAPKLDTLEVSGAYLRDELSKRVAFDPETYHYYVIVPFEKNEVEILATSTKGDVFGTGNKQVNVGTQDFAVQVVAPNGMATTYTITVFRLPEIYSNSFAEIIKISEIQEFNDAFKPTQTFGYAYTVPNKVTDLSISVELQFEDDNVNDDLEAKYEVYGDKNLRVGLNNVVVVVTSADGLNQTTYLIQVTREAKQYEVNNKNEAVKDFTLEQNKNESGELIENEFTVDIGSKKTSDVDFSKFIENLNPDKQNLDVEVITDITTNPDEVVVRISDGDETEFVKFQVTSTGNPTGFQGQEWTFLLLLAIILIVLIAILFTVNKDKYGKITKKTNRRSERKEKREDAKRK